MNLAITKNPKSQRILYTVLILTLLWSSLFAQEINEGSSYMSLGKQNSFSLEIDNATKDNVVDSWRAYVKENKFGKIKRNKKEDEWYGNKMRISEIPSNLPIGLYTKVEQKGNYVILTSWLDLGDRFVSTNTSPEEAIAFTGILEDFYFYSKRRNLSTDLKSQQKQLSKDEKTLKKLDARHEKLKKSIDKNSAKIEQNQNDIEVLVNEKINQLENVEEERLALQNIYTQDASADMIKNQQKALQKAEKALDKIKAKTRKLEDSIVKMKRQNEDNSDEIESIIINQEGQKYRIDTQRTLIDNLQDKINDLRP